MGHSRSTGKRLRIFVDHGSIIRERRGRGVAKRDRGITEARSDNAFLLDLGTR